MNAVVTDLSDQAIEQMLVACEKALTAVMEHAEMRTKLPPDQGGSPRLTGNNADSISWEFIKRGGDIAARIFTASNYGAYLEFGTRYMAARPYMGPAMVHGHLVMEEYNWEV